MFVFVNHNYRTLRKHTERKLRSLDSHFHPNYKRVVKHISGQNEHLFARDFDKVVAKQVFDAEVADVVTDRRLQVEHKQFSSVDHDLDRRADVQQELGVLALLILRHERDRVLEHWKHDRLIGSLDPVDLFVRGWQRDAAVVDNPCGRVDVGVPDRHVEVEKRSRDVVS